MDDDLLLLNLADSSQPGNSKKPSGAKKGGRWTDRAKAKRVATKRSSTSDPPGPQQPAKKRKIAPLDEPAAESRPSQLPTKQQGQIISSLFTSNPSIPAPAPAAFQPSKKSKPSNAVLTDSSTFSGLGLDPLLVSHLSSKMSVQTPTGIQRSSLSLLLPLQDNENTRDRDAFIQSQTGSGKTLAYLLPIVQQLLALCHESWIDRTIGTLAIIVAPTRELASQIHSVLESLLRLNLGEGMTRFLVAGLLIGGATRQHDKARLRKGVGILVATPGRLLDHLQHTSSFEVGKCQWLVLDEADHLMSLGFEQTIKDIVENLNSRRRLAVQVCFFFVFVIGEARVLMVHESQAQKEGILGSIGWDFEARCRRTILCSATMRDDVKKLAGWTLHNPIMIKELLDPNATPTPVEQKSLLQAPSQLNQKYVVVPLKLRLVTLVALLRSLLAREEGSAKVIVFFSCTDSVDWHLDAFESWGSDQNSPKGNDDGSDDERDGNSHEPSRSTKTVATSPLLPNTMIHKLHGNLPTASRLSSLSSFSSATPKQNRIMFTTSLSSRGLSIPHVGFVIQYDLPTEGGMNEYIHRVGRTARLGAKGEAWCFLSPSEDAWVGWAQQELNDLKLSQESVEHVLRLGFTPTLMKGKGKDYEQRATEVQLGFERVVLKDVKVAQGAFSSHVKAYTTHPSAEKHIFHVKNLHLGHLAKSFGLREAPSNILSNKKNDKKRTPHSHRYHKKEKGVADSSDDDAQEGEAERRMTAVVRAQGRAIKKGGKIMRVGGLEEFQVGTSGYALD
ncbi:DEAD-domain-containing protein [Flagelloscypha sp. PMI_526]|nr:DEAD-domain-containing protein [Flagelloscypha sp. PMI_526]